MQVITDQYRKLNETLHNTNIHYGTSGHLYANEILGLCKKHNITDVLDYGCGKNTLANSLPFEIKKYDPAIRAFHEEPEPADLVCCTDVMEHIEPELLDNVLTHMKSKTKKLLFMTISTQPAKKTLADGRNAHICLMDSVKWFNKISEYFLILNLQRQGELLVLLCTPVEKLEIQGNSNE